MGTHLHRRRRRKNGEVAAAAVAHNTEQGAFLGTLATVSDGEEKGITLALDSDVDKLLILTDSMAGKQAVLNLSKGAPPRSGIEERLKDLLRRRAYQTTAIGWVSSHIGIPGNEKADKRAAYESALGQGSAPAGALWHRHALSAYTRLRTDRGPFNYWLHFVRKVDSHLAMVMPHARRSPHRLRLPPTPPTAPGVDRRQKTWEELDTPIWRKEKGEEREWDAVEAYFAYLYRPLARR
ncbi:hypothetical protein EV426DRAFT_716505 [Tirmania nivea]|nr:hypothetical protein EV426DRAFT_716505 [Tirmania nivea]